MTGREYMDKVNELERKVEELKAKNEELDKNLHAQFMHTYGMVGDLQNTIIRMLEVLIPTMDRIKQLEDAKKEHKNG